ncbi:inositol polyphosphate 5-phosphatase K isoform X1 [Falco biarmicus]|uniref:inositol polyphosphate 5-phosphatase K isoform X1 n=1 Tax=Falco peregrinus TaxID=8954 RepID=UPI000FFB931F|nr:inositol polyphosphate 5-phosphatase K isoform X1 [Falco peregrinus]XP_027662031.1 inositol polyphosphate 5-phosphatase K isoform X1 [Falco cherrug]XP_037230476.1 inositol polyphosphate 5-phosphatase K isoform X1 [Falco rusticolus]XP_056209452.1 inositol polyphosphate 5-phosphatase K isoform X1 [Falco biarmicus]
MASFNSEDAFQDSSFSLNDLESLHNFRSRSASLSSTGSSGRLQLRQRVAQLMACVEDISSDDEIHEEVSRTLDEAFLMWGKRLKDKWQEFRLHLVTWNVGTASPPPDVTSLLQLNSLGPTMDMYVIGLQEVNSRITNFLSDLAFDDPWSIFFMTVLSPLGYIKLSSVRMQGLLLLIFVKHVHLPFIRDIHTHYIRTGLYGYWGNKGGVTARMSLYGHTICFMNCHLPAHMENTEQRLDDFEKILEMQFEGENIPSTLDHDVLFWFGDLNFRIADYGIHFVRESINNKRYNLLWEKDQLNMAKKKEAFLQEFIEGPLQFKPTYKFDLYSDVYDTREQKSLFWFNEKKRKPAWTDRILWRVKNLCQHAPKEGEFSEEQTISVTLNNYISHMSYGISDHKPVTGTFGLELKPLLSDPLVTLNPEGEWSSEHDVLISYSAVPEFPSSAWDWIGLFKVAFRHVNDYVTYAWVEDDEISSNKDSKQVYMSAAEIPDMGGEFFLCYYSNNLQSIVGISEPFQIQPNRSLIEKDLTQEENSWMQKPDNLESHNDF